MELLREIGRYASRLVRQPIGSVVAAVSFVLYIVSASKGHTVGLPPWAWALIAEGAVVLAGFLDWRLTSEKDPEHISSLRRVAQSVVNSLSSGMWEIEYSDGEHNDETLRRLFRDHFADEGLLIERLDEWERLGKELPSVQDSASARMRMAAKEFVEKNLAGGSIQAAVRSVELYTNSYRGQPKKPAPQFHLASQTFNWGSQVLLWLDKPPNELQREAVGALAERSNAAMVDILQMWPSNEIAAIHAARAAIRESVSDQLRLIVHHKRVPGDCDSCDPRSAIRRRNRRARQLARSSVAP